MYIMTPTKTNTGQASEPSVLPLKQRKAVTALITHRTHEEAAGVAGVSTATIYRYLALPAFRAELTRQQDAATTDAIRLFAGNVNAAIGVLIDVATDTTEKASSRVNAARVFLAEARQWRDVVELEERIAALEQAILEDR